MTFIQEILATLTQNGQLETRNLIFLFPSKRPAAYLKKELSQQSDGPIISPTCLAIADFITEYSQLTPVDTMTLVFELFGCYLDQLKDGQKGLDLLQFYPLGETLMADFGDIDKDMVNAQALFANFSQLKDIDANFDIEDEQMETFRNFWKHFSAQEPKKMQQEFLDLWNMMGALYFEFRTHLQQKKLGYAGLAERNMVDNFGDFQQHFLGKTICICGFNALTKAEIKLFKELETVTTLKYFFDYDEHYLQPIHEAGYFMRRNFKELQIVPKDSFAKRNHLLAPHKMKLTTASGTTGMVQALFHDVLALDPSLFNENTGIVLPDEHALKACLEVLHALPLNINITMGLPLQSTGIWSLIKTLFALQNNFSNHQKSFLYRDVLQVLQHPELAIFQNLASFQLQNEIARQNYMFCTEKMLGEKALHHGFRQIFKAINLQSIFPFIQEILALIETHSSGNDHLKQTILVHAYQQCSRFNNLYSSYLVNVSTNEVWLLFKKATSVVNIAFEGEPLKGVQLMGLLESRAIDFETLFVLSVNEGIIPKSSRHQSLIPYSIRKAFGMNTFREDDAVSAYYFYRMLQRAKNIYLYCNSDTDGNGKGEMSRYILQIQEELPNFSTVKYNFSLRSAPKEIPHLSIAKSPEVLASLGQYEVNEGSAKRALSPSALSTYIKSPIQFYLRFVANFKERDEVLEEMDPITLGNIVHNTLEVLYSLHLNQEITFDIINQLEKEQLKPTLERFLEQEMNLKPTLLQGRNLLFYNICHKLCVNVLRADAKTKGVKIVNLEFDDLFYDIQIETNEGPKIIRLKGQFDRLDEVNGQIRVVDYKTGMIEIPSQKAIQSTPFENAKFAAVLQTLFYTLVYLKNFPTQAVIPVIYSLKSSENLVQPVVENPLTLGNLTDFEEFLKQKLEEIWNSNQAFSFVDYNEEGKYLMMEVL